MRESVIQDQIIKWLRKQGAYAINIHGGPMQEGGVADILCCWDGVFVTFEVKVPGQYPSPLQQHHIEKVNEARGYAFCVHSVEEVKTAWAETEASLNAKLGL